MQMKNTNKKTLFKVVSFSPALQYIEMYKTNESPNKTQYYIVEKHNLLIDLEKKVNDSAISVMVVKKNKKNLGEIIQFTPYTKQITINMDNDNSDKSTEVDISN